MSTTSYTLVVGPLPASLLSEISREQVFQDALQVLVNQNEEADLANGIMVTRNGDSKQYEARFSVSDKKTRSSGEYMQLVFTRTPEGEAFVYFDSQNPDYTGPSQPDDAAKWPCWLVKWSDWGPTGEWKCHTFLWLCFWSPGQLAYFVQEVRSKYCDGQWKYDYRWRLDHCTCP